MHRAFQKNFSWTGGLTLERHKILFLTWKRTSKTLKLLDFLNFIVTNPMVPNLASVFFYWDGFEEPFCEDFTKRKWLFYRILTFSSELWTRPAYFKVTIMPPKGLETVYIYPSEYLRRNLTKCWAQLEAKVTPTSDDLLTSNLFGCPAAL